MITPASCCRICGNQNLVQILDLGEQVLTGVFPADPAQTVAAGPLRLVKCVGGEETCGLVQLAHSYDASEMYGANYGYRSGLNASMVRHLERKVRAIEAFAPLSTGNIVLDIGSNDGTTLGHYQRRDLRFIGIDPTAEKFRAYYPAGVTILPDFFSAAVFDKAFPGEKARVVTSFSMLYDLERPLDFVREVASILADDGVWVFEQSYLPTMLAQNSYDTVCHEHIEYYALRQIKWMTDRAGLKIVDVNLNDVNGGSFSVMAAKAESPYAEFAGLGAILQEERSAGLDALQPYEAFAARVDETRRRLLDFLSEETAKGKRIAGLGASTKGNVLLQYCGLDTSQLFAIAEVNADKFGKFTPGTLIPIQSEAEVFASQPDYLVVLPWHFRQFFVERAKDMPGRLVFPLPELEVAET